jgi:hypothetical protein
MNNNILIAVIVLLLVLLTLQWFDNKESVETPIVVSDTAEISDRPAIAEAPGADDAADVLAKGSSNRRTWVIHEADQPDNEHIGIGDAFRIIKAGSSRKLKPLTQLKNRWKKSGGFEVDLIKSPHPLLCGSIVLDPHPGTMKHLIVIRSDGPDGLIVDYEIYDDGLTLEENCQPISGTHGGRAHAEN